jgi:RHS repeat-associated protein
VSGHPNRAYAQVVKEINATTGNVTDYLYGDDLIKQTRAANDSYYLYDGLGSTRALTDDAGSVTDSYDYESFGSVLNQTGSTENNYLFTGEQFDTGLDNYYLRARYYDQNVGRFTQMDTWMGNTNDPVTLHKYLYANADPVGMIDPSGNISLASISTATTISRILTTISIGSTAVTVYEFGTGEREVSAQEVGMAALVLFSGPAAGKLIKILTRKKVDDFLKKAVSNGSVAKLLIKNGRVSITDLRRMIPPGTPNTFKPTVNILGGFKYNFKIGKIDFEVKWHTPSARAAIKHPGSNAGNMSTAQIKIDGKLLTTEGGFRKHANNSTHLPIDF